ncbi:protein kinase domain-containing protein [Luteimonas sp. A478]
MDPDQLAQWQAADALFDHWLDLRPAERDAWLAGQDPEPPVRQRLEQLIAAHQRPRATMDPTGSNLSGCQLGDWTLESELGRGGMAVVYRAWREQGMARQQAAIKILTLGALGLTGRERFHREAAILARLNHPNVTALVDSGVADDGTCWLAMPLVDGDRIDAWCDAQSLDARAIVRLYLQVCDAVAYAHRNLVIHRDLKPSNVLVDRDGHVRLLDFGIGQFADDDGERTHTMWRALTPGYAAPEQLRGAPPTTVMDIYGLGALLHRLLTGRTPGGGEAGTHSTRPSLLVRDAGDAYHRHYVPLKSDLDRVLLKALAEEPGQRYATAEALADDLRRWLDGRPVLAQKPKIGYRARKFITRNKVGVAAGMLLAITMAGGIATTLWQAGKAREQAELAEHQAELAQREAGKANARAGRAEDVRDMIGYAFLNARGNDGGPASAADLLQTASDRARSEDFADTPLTAADVLLLTGTVRFNLEDHEHSLEDLEQALELLAPHRDIAAGELARAHWELGRHARRNGDYRAVAAHAREAMELNALWDAPPLERFRTRVMLGDALLQIEPDAAGDHFRTLLADVEGSEVRESYMHLHVINGLLAAMWEASAEEKLPIQEERLRIARAFYGPGTAGLSFNLGEATHTLRALGMLDRAEALARESIETADISEQRPMLMRGMARCYLGFVLQQRGAHAESLDAFREGDGLMSQQSDSKGAFGRCLSAQAYAEVASGNPAEAIEVLARSDELLRASVGPAHFGIFTNCGFRASAELRRDRLVEASRVLDACLPEDEDAMQLGWHQARAERLLVTGEVNAASEALADLREKYPPQENHREWMRPWMASLLLAHQTDDATAMAALAGQLTAHAGVAPLSQCLAAPGEHTCLALP